MRTDNGASWSSANEGLPPQTHIRSLAVAGSSLFAGTNAGEVHFSSRSEIRWTALGDVIAGGPVLALHVTGDCLYAGISGGGVWKLHLSGLTGVDADRELVSARPALGQNHPNPFNPHTTISFILPDEAAVSLFVYDISGRLVNALVNGEVANQGRNEVIWRGVDRLGRPCPSGTYFYRLQAGEYVETRRMTLLN